MQELDISFGKNRSDTNWKTEYLSWDEFVDRLRKVRRTAETMAEYDRWDNIRRGKVKDGPAFVGGLVRGGRRKKENIDSRWLITLDVDSGDEDFLLTVDLMIGGTAYVVYSTHSHRDARPKYRLIIPANRAMSPDEYAAVSRKLAELIGMDYFDKTTFDVHRLMYLPSCSKDAEPVLEVLEGDALDVDAILGHYKDWTDVMQWPRHPHAADPILSNKKPQDPREKTGTIGLFCRSFTLEEGIDRFLQEEYSPGSMENRYTYNKGTSGNGLEVFPDQELAYSHQDSDPVADGRSYNLFDLVRIHKFGHLDERVSEKTNISKLPSVAAMEAWAIQLPEVKRERMSEISDSYGDLDDDNDPEEDTAEDDAWKEQLELHSKTGDLLATAGNVELLLSHEEWGGVLGYDAFGNTEVIRKPLPWRGRERAQADYEPWLGADDKRLQHWFAKAHKLRGAAMIQNAFTEVAHAHKFHPIKEYIEAQTWDGVPRLDTVFIDYLGAEDTHYIRQVTRKALLAAVARLYMPGCKFDEMLVLVGPQGAGKSSLLAKLGRRWFSDSLRTFENKEAGEHLQSGWIFEIGELSAMKKSEVDEVKAFLSKTEDRYRVAYDRQVSEFPRKCVFFGTTNTRDFLRDATGNRRFWPVEVFPVKAKFSHWEHLTDWTVGQIWAEALQAYNEGEILALDNVAKAAAAFMQQEHLEVDPRTGNIQEWLEKPVEDELGQVTSNYRTRVCASQIWTECLFNRAGSIRPWEAREIADIMRKMPGWEERKGKARIPGYGVQLVFERCLPPL
ncbi:virulence-associated E family protein [Paenibacillus sp. FSL R7-0273]|uniref:virulence-associated E family protein n=1 Tax=Paenibacillus sp. FSL R7-0273 TaxID=1536772 RepID=UPI000970FD99|nr:virulence-associated E family protein [Paenibacillus sp. FSL R7-0273]OMF95120.1 virulence protein E [Paenibacillus sp. FSL R7-0273]